MPKSIYLLSQANVAPSEGKENTPRKFSGIANSGKPFDHWGEMCIVDMNNLTHHETMPVLLLHDREKRAGHGKLSVSDHQLLINGTLLTNEHGKAIAEEADEDFPWQMSAHIVPASIEEVKTGTATVNGQVYSAPLTILRQCKVVEVSFTPTGVDDQTSATVLSDEGTPSPNPTEKETDMTLEEALAKIEALESEKKALEDENAELKANAKESKVEAELSQAGYAKGDDGKWQGIGEQTVNMLLSADDDSRQAIIADLAKGQSKPTPADIPQALLSEQHQPSSDKTGVQLSDNPLVAIATARAEGGGGGYI